MLFCRRLQPGQHHPGLNRCGAVPGINLKNPVHARKINHQLIAGGIRNPALDQAGIAALRNHGDVISSANFDDFGNFRGRFGKGHQRRLSGVAAAPVGHIAGRVLRLVQKPLRSQNALYVFDCRHVSRISAFKYLNWRIQEFFYRFSGDRACSQDHRGLPPDIQHRGFGADFTAAAIED